MGSTVDKYLIPKELKKTTKFTDEDRERVKSLYDQGWAKRKIAREMHMDKRMVDFILDPEKMKENAKKFAIRQKEGRYRYPTKEQSAMVAKVRKRKKAILSKLIKKP